MFLAFVVVDGPLLCNAFRFPKVCGGDFKVLADRCYQFVRVGGSPVLQSHPVGDIPCVCKHTTKPMDRFIGMKKVVLVSKCCGSPLERGTKCGSK